MLVMDGVMGSKAGAGVWQRIVSEMPPHRFYVEAFAGAAVVYRRKRGCELSLLIERDVDRLAPLAAVLQDRDYVVCGDAITILPGLGLGSDALVYADPPYPLGSRRGRRRLYRYEMTDDDHRRLCRCLRSLRCAVMASTYANAIYARELADWRVVTISTTVRGGGGSCELLYCNFPETDWRHDVRFVGHNYRERERIRRRVRRWVSMFRAMTPAERAACRAALDDDRGHR